MKSKKWLGVLLTTTMVLSSAATFAGCSKEKDNKEAEKETAKKDDDQYLSTVLMEPETLDPNKAGMVYDFQILSHIQEGLARILPNKDGVETVTPAGAESWEQSSDGLTWTFNLRKDAKWSDGKPVTAQQYVDSLLRILDQKNGFPYAFFAFDIKNAEDYYSGKSKVEDLGIKAKDDYTLVITLQKATPHFVKKLASTVFQPIRLDVIKAGGENWESDFKKHVFCGPFKMTEWTKQNSIVLEKNDSYWDAKNVSLKKVEMRKIEEFSTQAQLFESYQLDITGGQGEFIDKWKKMAQQGKFKFIQGRLPSTSFMIFNQKNGGPSGLMKNAKIRKALSLCLDRQEFVDTIYGRRFPAFSLIPTGIKIGDKDFRGAHKEEFKTEYEKYKGKNDEIQKLFKEGLKELGKSEDLSAVTLKFITSGSTSTLKAIQEYWQQSWQNKLGIKIKMEIAGDDKVLTNLRKDFKYDVTSYGWNGDYDDPLTFMDLWLTGSSYATELGGYSNPKYDELFKKLDGEKDLAKREEIYSKLENILINEDYAIAPYMFDDTVRFMHNYVKNISYPMFGPSYEFSRAYTAGRPAK